MTALEQAVHRFLYEAYSEDDEWPDVSPAHVIQCHDWIEVNVDSQALAQIRAEVPGWTEKPDRKTVELIAAAIFACHFEEFFREEEAAGRMGSILRPKANGSLGRFWFKVEDREKLGRAEDNN